MHASPFHSGSTCSVCPQTECPMSEGQCPELAETQRPLKGALFSLTCVLVFILPLALAILASVRFASNPSHGLLAGLAGFLIGSLLSRVCTHLLSIEARRSH